MSQIVKRKKKGRPSKADLARRTSGVSPRRSVRPRNVKYIFDYDDFLDFDDEEDNPKRKKLQLLLNSPPEDVTDMGLELELNTPPLIKKRKIDVTEEKQKGEAEAITLPDKRVLELILDKLQKKDIYGVYAEPVDPEELPDYHELISNPMDFATIRMKVGNGVYTNLEEFENDVFLLCSNAMEYNEPDTIYYKHACSIEELAKRKFQRLRIDMEGPAKDVKSELKTRSNSLTRKQIKKPISKKVQEPVGSDFSCGATLATSGEQEKSSNVAHVGGCERPSGFDGLVEGNSAFIDRNLDKGEELTPVKGLIPRPGRKLSVHDDNRRSTYNKSSGAVAILATTGDLEKGPNVDHVGASERPSGVDKVIEGNSNLIDSNLDMGEELLPVKGPIPRLGRKLFVHDDNRRATYNISCEAVAASESIFSTFEGESRQLVPVGLHADHSYARSLSRFAANVGPVVWKVASPRIKQALPEEMKFGPGWVGEYEPLSKPLLMLQNCTPKEPAVYNPGEFDKTSEMKSPSFGPVGTRITTNLSTNNFSSAKDDLVRGDRLNGKQNLSCSPRTIPTDFVSVNYQRQNSVSRNSIEPEKNIPNQVELNCLPLANQNTAGFIAERQILNGSQFPDSRNMNVLQSGSFKQSNIGEVVAKQVPNGIAMSKILANSNNTMRNSFPGTFPNQMARAPAYFSQGEDNGHLMRMLAERNAQNQSNSSNPSSVDIQPVRPDLSDAASAAARAWMCAGAQGIKPILENTSTHKTQISPNSVYNPTAYRQAQVSKYMGEFPASGMHLMNGFPHNAFAPQPVRISNEAQFQNHSMGFPQLVKADSSRFLMQPSHWQGLNQQMQPPRHRQEPLPPDLNIGFQSRASSVRQGDSQQPDLALQL